MKYLLSILLFLFLAFYIHSNPVDISDITNEATKNENPNIRDNKVHSVIDVFDGVKIYDNRGFKNTYGRHLAEDGYNLGLKWQCVEFVKRFYYKKYDHKMPNSYGHAKDFFDKSVGSGWNKNRGLQQYQNKNHIRPSHKSILVFDGNKENPYGHIAIISNVRDGFIEVAQQNWGKQTRMILPLLLVDGYYYIDHKDVLGWLSNQ